MLESDGEGSGAVRQREADAAVARVRGQSCHLALWEEQEQEKGAQRKTRSQGERQWEAWP